MRPRGTPRWCSPNQMIEQFGLSGGKLVIESNASRAVLDGWDDAVRLFWFGIGIVDRRQSHRVLAGRTRDAAVPPHRARPARDARRRLPHALARFSRHGSERDRRRVQPHGAIDPGKHERAAGSDRSERAARTKPRTRADGAEPHRGRTPSHRARTARRNRTERDGDPQPRAIARASLPRQRCEGARHRATHRRHRRAAVFVDARSDSESASARARRSHARRCAAGTGRAMAQAISRRRIHARAGRRAGDARRKLSARRVPHRAGSGGECIASRRTETYRHRRARRGEFARTRGARQRQRLARRLAKARPLRHSRHARTRAYTRRRRSRRWIGKRRRSRRSPFTFGDSWNER